MPGLRFLLYISYIIIGGLILFKIIKYWNLTLEKDDEREKTRWAYDVGPGIFESPQQHHTA